MTFVDERHYDEVGWTLEELEKAILGAERMASGLQDWQKYLA